jgi:hypothetical protein
VIHEEPRGTEKKKEKKIRGDSHEEPRGMTERDKSLVTFYCVYFILYIFCLVT